MDYFIPHALDYIILVHALACEGNDRKENDRKYDYSSEPEGEAFTETYLYRYMNLFCVQSRSNSPTQSPSGEAKIYPAGLVQGRARRPQLARGITANPWVKYLRGYIRW